MATKELSTKVAIVGRGAKCKGGKSAVEQSSYISRTTLYSDYYGENFYPKYSEDLVHTEIMLPENAPEKYMDRSILWNSAEEAERKSPKAQIARSYKVSLPNDWSYDLATEVMRDYVKRNFVDDGMCAEFAIHDSENPQHQRNLHCHILLTKSKPEYGKLVTQLAYAEVITHNKANYEREQANEQRKPTRTKRKEQEI